MHTLAQELPNCPDLRKWQGIQWQKEPEEELPVLREDWSELSGLCFKIEQGLSFASPTSKYTIH